MRILDKHVIKEFILAFLSSLFVFLFLFTIVDSFSNLDDFIKNKIVIGIIFQYYLTLLPTIFLQTSPIACLLATIYTIGKLNYNNELIAMRSGGLSIYKIITPIVIFAMMLSLFTFLVSEKIVTITQATSDRIKAVYIDKKELYANEILKNMAVYGSGNRQLFINTFDTKNNSVDGLTMLEHDARQNVVSKIFANKAVWKENFWLANQCLLYQFDENSHLKNYEFLENYKLPIEDTPRDFLRQRLKISYMSSKELLNYINKLSSSGAETAIRNLYIDLYHKILNPFTAIVMIFIGLPCAMVIRRKAVGFSSIGISILIALVYYIIQAVSMALGKNNIFPALASVIITPTVFILSSMYLVLVSP